MLWVLTTINLPLPTPIYSHKYNHPIIPIVIQQTPTDQLLGARLGVNHLNALLFF